MSISHIQICYQLLQTHPSAHSLNPPICPFLKPTHPSATNPQPFCLPGDDCRTYGRLTDPKKPTLKIPPSKAWCRLHRANATSPPAQRIASQPVRSASARASPVHHSAPRECNQPARIASHRKQSAHRAARRPHL